MKKLLILAAIMFMAITFAACSKDDNGDGKKNEMKDSSYVGTLTVTQADGSLYTQSGTEVSLKRTDDKTAEMKMLKVKFSDRMPLTLDMTVSGINYSVAGTRFTISGDNLIPTAMGGEFPAYTITSLSGTFDDQSIDFSLTCGGTYPLTFTGEVKE